MNLDEARVAINAILDAIPDEAMPEFDHFEDEGDGKVLAWFGGRGIVIGSAKRDGVRDPSIYRDNAARSAIDEEMAYRLDRRFHENGDSLDGLGIEVSA